LIDETFDAPPDDGTPVVALLIRNLGTRELLRQKELTPEDISVRHHCYITVGT
jgi:hypothetical protein